METKCCLASSGFSSSFRIQNNCKERWKTKAIFYGFWIVPLKLGLHPDQITWHSAQASCSVHNRDAEYVAVQYPNATFQRGWLSSISLGDLIWVGNFYYPSSSYFMACYGRTDETKWYMIWVGLPLCLIWSVPANLEFYLLILHNFICEPHKWWQVRLERL